MALHYYMTVFPMEALVASQLEPEHFASYMALGDKKAAAEQLMFVEIEGGFGKYFDWEFAERKCVPHSDGRPKNSLYLSVYRVLENIQLTAMGSLYLVTKDGRSLVLEKKGYSAPANWKGYALYREYCPMSPLAVSSLDPKKYGEHMTEENNKVHVPTLFFADLKLGNVDNIEESGNVGQIYDKNLEHLQSCVHALQAGKGKMTKIVDRSNFNSSFYQIIDNGLYISSGDDIIMYPMPSRDELKKIDYDWGRSALIF